MTNTSSCGCLMQKQKTQCPSPVALIVMLVLVFHAIIPIQGKKKQKDGKDKELEDNLKNAV